MIQKRLHTDNKHKNGYDFRLLTTKYPPLLEYIDYKYDNLSIDFSNPKAVKELNKALLFTYYGITYWDFPDVNLCPPIPGRVDYIHYLSELIIDTTATVKVLDIGTGATCIYPLLGNAEYNWQFVATDIDRESLKTAQTIIDKNKLASQIELRLQKDKNHILEDVVNGHEFTLTMCNPPFFSSLLEAEKANKRKTTNLKIDAKRNFSGNSNELCYTGGEKAFLHTYLYESSKYPKASEWFTSLVSKKENIKSLEDSAKKLGVSECKTIPMYQGNKITRIFCWRF